LIMAVSGSFDFTQNRSQIISNSFVESGVLRPDETPESDESVFAAVQLNMMLKAFQADGLHIFAHRDAFLFLEKEKINYKLGPTGDNATESFTETAIRVAAAITDTTMEVDSTTGMTAADFVGIEQDDGNMHWTTVASVTDSDTFEITLGLTAAASIDNRVYFYTDKIQRPLRLAKAFYQLREVDTTMFLISRSDYMNLSSKNTESQPTEIYFNPLLNNSELNVYGEPNDVTGQIFMNLQFPFDDMDKATDNLAFPIEWLETIHLGLSYRLRRSYSPADQKTALLRNDADVALQKSLAFDEEKSDIQTFPTEQWSNTWNR